MTDFTSHPYTLAGEPLHPATIGFTGGELVQMEQQTRTSRIEIIGDVDLRQSPESLGLFTAHLPVSSNHVLVKVEERQQ